MASHIPPSTLDPWSSPLHTATIPWHGPTILLVCINCCISLNTSLYSANVLSSDQPLHDMCTLWHITSQLLIWSISSHMLTWLHVSSFTTYFPTKLHIHHNFPGNTHAILQGNVISSPNFYVMFSSPLHRQCCCIINISFSLLILNIK